MVAVMRVLDARRSPITTHDLTVAALEVPPKPGGLPVPTHVQMSSVRRAVGTLREAGKVFDCGRRRGGRRAWASRAAAEDFAAWILANRGEAALARFHDLVPLSAPAACSGRALQATTVQNGTQQGAGDGSSEGVPSDATRKA